MVGEVGVAHLVGVLQRLLQLLTPGEDAEDELVALVAVLAEQRVEPLEGRRVHPREAVRLEHLADRRHGPMAAGDLVGEEVARPARGVGVQLHGGRCLVVVHVVHRATVLAAVRATAGSGVPRGLPQVRIRGPLAPHRGRPAVTGEDRTRRIHGRPVRVVG